MKILNYSFLLFAMFITNNVSAGIMKTKLTVTTPLEVQLNKDDILLVSYNLHHVQTRAGNTWNLACITLNGDPVTIEYAYQGAIKQATLPETFNFFRNEANPPQIDEEGEFKLFIAKDHMAKIKCEMY